MTQLDLFYILKQKTLVKYREQYPFYQGNLQEFGNKEIAQLLDLIEKDTNERVSEKWVYTHLKPVENTKLPRKDMLDIFSLWVGFTNWDEFVFVNNNEFVDVQDAKNARPKKISIKAIILMGTGGLLFILVSVISFTGIGTAKNEITVCFKDRYTQKSIDTDKFSLFVLENGSKKKLEVNKNCSQIKSGESQVVIIVESPYYKKDTITINMKGGDTHLNYDLQPDDYAMMMRAYMNSDLEDWNRRKRQLDDILSDDAVIQEIMFDEIGVEFFNKDEFITKIITPTTNIKQMEIVEIEYEGDKIISLKYVQK